MQRILPLTLVFLSPNALFGQGNLVLSSGVGSGGGTAMNLTLSSPVGSQPAGIQWTLTYSPQHILSINAVAAGSAAAAGKAVQCSTGVGTYTCLLLGQNSTLIQNGVVAVVNLNLAAGVAGTTIGLIKTQGATPDGFYLGLTGVGGAVSAPVPALEGLSCIPGSLTAGGSSTCTVTLSTTQGGTVMLASNNSALIVPASVSVGAGSTSATFAATAGAISNDQIASVTASLNGASRTASIGLVGVASVTSLACAPSTLAAGESSTCTVTLSGAGGGSITLATSNDALTVPASIGVTPGSTTATFSTTAGVISTDQTASVTASLGGVSQKVSIELVVPVRVTSLACAPSILNAGASSVCTVTLSKRGGGNVTVASSAAALTVPASVSVDPGSTAATFAASAGSISIDQTVAVTASLNGSSEAASIVLNLEPESVIASLSCLPDPVAAGALNCAIQLTEAARAGGVFVSLQSNSPRLQLPQQIPIPGGQQSATFSIRVFPSDQNEQLRITASVQDAARTMSVSVLGIRPTALRLSTTAIQAGNWLDAEIRLNSSNVPDSVSLALASSSPNLRIPSSITTRPGQTRVTFKVYADADAVPENGEIFGQFGHTAVRTPIVVTPSGTLSLSLPRALATRFDEKVAFTISAVDPLGLPMVYSVEPLPIGASFDPVTGRFSWTPGRSQEGIYDLTFTATNSAKASAVGHVGIAVDSGKPVITGIRNAARRSGPACSPGSLASIEGRWLSAGNDSVSEPSGGVMVLSGTRVHVNGQDAPLVYASRERVDFVCPALDPGTILAISAETGAGITGPVTANMAALAPGLFALDGSGSGQGMVYLAGTSLFAASRDYQSLGQPAESGDLITIRATGIGSPDSLPPTVVLGSFIAQVDSVRAVPAMAGVSEITIRVPPGIPESDRVPLEVIFRQPAGLEAPGSLRSNQITIAIESPRL